MNNKKLLIVFVVLIGVYGLSRLLTKSKSSTFEPELVRVDTALVDRIILNTKAPNSEEVLLTRKNGTWEATNGVLTVTSPKDKVGGLLNSVVAIDAMRVITRSKEKWPVYEVGEGATRLRMYQGNTVLMDMTVGGFKFDQTRRSAASYLRPTSDDEVYLVDGFLSMQFNRDFNAFRNNSIVRLNTADLNRIEVAHEDLDVVLERQLDGQWYRSGMEQIDSTQMAAYINGLAQLTGNEFVDSGVGGAAAIKQLRLVSNNTLEPLTVDFYEQSGSSSYIVNSSINPDTYFAVDSLLYQRILGKLEATIDAL